MLLPSLALQAGPKPVYVLLFYDRGVVDEVKGGQQALGVFMLSARWRDTLLKACHDLLYEKAQIYYAATYLTWLADLVAHTAAGDERMHLRISDAAAAAEAWAWEERSVQTVCDTNTLTAADA